MMFLRYSIYALLIFCANSVAEEYVDTIDKQQTILVVGDSLSAAYGIEPEQGWVSLLDKRLEQYSENINWNVVNASVSGETTSGGLARLAELLHDHQPDICIIALGANDGLRGQPIKLMERNLIEMIDACHRYGESLLVGMKLPPNYGEKYASMFYEAYTRVAKETDIDHVPFMLEDIALEDSYFQEDGLHPTAYAQPLILDTIWTTLEVSLLK